MTFAVFSMKATAFLLSIFLTFIPYAGIELPVLQTAQEDCLLNLELISDIHLEPNGFFRNGILKQGLRTMNRSRSKIDGIVVAGDITNYADELSVKQYYEIIKKLAPAPVVTAAGNHEIGHAGDRNVTDITREEALANFIKYQNEYAGTNNTTNYYTYYINGYKFIVLGDEVVDGGHWDAVSMTQEQLDFLDNELESANGEPVFVVCHWPIKGINGEEFIWEGSGIDPEEYNVKGVLEKYKHVFYISGHMHSGISSTIADEKYGIHSAQQVNGVTYITLPSFGLVNQYGIPWFGTGAQLELYEDKVLYRPVNYLTGNWYTNSAYEFKLV